MLSWQLVLVAQVPREPASLQGDQNGVGDQRVSGRGVGTWRPMEKRKGEGMSGVDEKSGLGHQCQQVLLLLLTNGLGAHKLSADLSIFLDRAALRWQVSAIGQEATVRTRPAPAGVLPPAPPRLTS